MPVQILPRPADERTARSDTSPPAERPPAGPGAGGSPYAAFIHESRQRVLRFYEELGERQLAWNRRFRYFRHHLAGLLQHFVRPGARVLDIGCGTGDFLAAVQPAEGVGVDCSPAMVRLAARRYRHLTFATAFAEELDQADIPPGPYDYILMVNTLGELCDIQASLGRIHRFCAPSTRLIIVQYNYLWEPICRLAARMGLKLDNPTPNWLSPRDLKGFLHLAGFETVRQGWTMPLPLRVPGLNWLFNSLLGRFYGTRALGFLNYVVARPLMPVERAGGYRVSVVVPCKNEEDNIDGLVDRIPEMGAGTEIIFVDDRSTDRTAERIRLAAARRPDRDIRLVQGPGLGKGAACRAGFAAASGDVFMILDADMTVMPEELPLFYEALTAGRGEFINGSRLVYPLADQAMRPLNILGNKAFAMLFSLLLEQPVRDTLCGTKVIWRRDYPKLMESRHYFQSCDVWGDYDWIFGAARHNLKIVELPVHYRERTAGATKMTRRLRNAWTMLRMCAIAFRRLRWI